MTELIREWVLGVFRVSLLSAIALALTPKGKVQKVLRLLCGAAMAIALISPVMGFDFDSYSLSLARYRELRDSAAAAASETSQRLERVVIEQECAAYILDKAQAMGLDVTSASVSAKWGDSGCWYPYEVKITVPGGEKLSGLAGVITSELGVPEERQYWSDG